MCDTGCEKFFLGGERSTGVRQVQLYNTVIRLYCTSGNMYFQLEMKKWCKIRMKKNKGNHLLLLLKKVGSGRLGESDIHPISPKTPAAQYQPIDRKKRMGKRVEDYSLKDYRES